MDNNRTDLRIRFDLPTEVDRMMLAKYAPAGVVIDQRLEIVEFRGETTPYLAHPPGLASFNLLKMARPGLAMELDTAIRRAAREGVPVRREGILMIRNEQSQAVNIEVFPLNSPVRESSGFLIVFEEAFSGSDGGRSEQKTPPEGTDQPDLADREETATLERRPAVFEERRAVWEQLDAANQAIQSNHEALQSAYQEMEAAKEELQATNEELTTVNEELRGRNLELSRVNSDLNYFLASINIPVVILDKDLRIRRFTATARPLFNLITADLGRAFKDINSNIQLPGLQELILEVIRTGAVREQEAQDLGGRWYSLRIRPYRAAENRTDGVVLTLLDIDTFKPSLEGLQESRDYIAIVETIREPFLILDAGFRVKLANQSFYHAFQVAPSEVADRSIFDLGDGEWNIPILRALLEEILPRNASFHDFKVEYYSPGTGRRVMLLNARRVPGEGRLIPFILLAFEDITGEI